MLLTTLLLPTPPGSRRRLSVAAKFRRLLNGLVAAMIAHHARRAARTALHRFDDRALQDIGLARGRIDGAIECAALRLATS
jgi:uncharacterized protein YjiS (DUF1127 family)